MSGITPLLDTLLPQVLGKRVDTPLQKALNPPVQPAREVDAPHQVFSDSRLNHSKNLVESLLSRSVVSEAKLANQAVRGESSRANSSSVETTLSPTARVISEVLSKPVVRPSVIQQSQPLIRDTTEFSTSLLSNRLQSSISESGLFYESHLARWYRGSLPRERLGREPQMQLFTRLHSMSRSDGDKFRGSQAKLQSDQKPLVSVAPGQTPVPSRTLLPPAATQPESLELGHKVIGEGSEQDVVDTAKLTELLRGVVSHQLELLSTPLLHWEGDVWSGVFMALLIQIPETLTHRGGESGDDADTDDDSGAEWSSELALNMKNVGLLKVKIKLKGEALTLWLQLPSEQVLSEVDDKKGILLDRLRACGFDSTNLITVLAENIDP